MYSHTPSYCASDLWTFELPPFPEVAMLASELWLFSGMALLANQLPVTGVTVSCLQTQFALHLFVLLHYTL
jgi:hypothetical protein